MKITTQNRKIWLDFFKAAEAFRDLAPWKWMWDQDLFGVQDPATGETGWCCIMGAAKEVFALGVYPGREGYRTFLNLVNLNDNTEETDRVAAGLGQHILKTEFVNRDETDETDRKAFKKLGLKFHGNNQWIQAREMKPGYLPYYLNDKQVLFLTHAFHQAMDVTVRFKQNKELLQDKYEKTLVRVPQQTGAGLVWKDEYIPEPTFDAEAPREVSSFLVNWALKELKRENAAICFSLSYVPGGVNKGEGESRPYFAKLALWIAYGSAYILGFEIFSPKQFEKQFDKKFIGQLFQIGIIPSQFIVNSLFAYWTLKPLTLALDIELIFAPEVEDFSEVDEGFMQTFMRRF